MIEKRLLHIPVFQHVLVIIEVILCEVREDTTCKVKGMHPLLVDSMRANLHEGVLTTGIHHLAKQSIQGDGVHCSMSCWITISVHIIGYR